MFVCVCVWGVFGYGDKEILLTLQFQEEWEEEEEEGEGFCSQIRTVLSPLQEAKTRGVSAVPVAGFQTRLHTLSVWPSRVWSSFSSQAPS